MMIALYLLKLTSTVIIAWLAIDLARQMPHRGRLELALVVGAVYAAVWVGWGALRGWTI